ncbi:hypothetical protein BU24DRAFT_473278 [Aaosphaeria arxii CBS 175.79]|uniref:Myb-like domain-containing protein n=1 Tax=Aaosphaeria arxii CBS 175.79 TaxID=1450172 RepID=A0A6A5XAK6_9PLEO|nr:uncharacterized protein BU24DRAFT_473278 [Aaosphaeria arxii CBS 175.79]KAF2010095.1 hypothetical protein BU24DRAFT_473278 [Aaosphaeria arxii CBS 175.79]
MASPEWPPKEMRISKSYLLGWSEKPLKPRTPPIHNPYKEVVSSPGAMIEYVASDGRKGKVSGLPNSFPQRLQTAQRLLTAKNLAKLPSEALQGKTASTVAKAAKSESKIGMLGGMGGLWDEDPKEDAGGWTKKQDDELMERKNAGEQWATIEKAMGKSKADLTKRFKDIKPADWRPSQTNKGSKGQKQKNNNKNQGKQEKQDGAEKKKTEASSWETADTGNNQSGDAEPWGNTWDTEAADVGNNSGGMGETFEGANKWESPQENTNDDNNGGFGGAASWDNADKKDEDVLPSWQTNDEDNKTTDNKSSKDDANGEDQSNGNGDSNGGGTSDWKNSSGDTGGAPAETFDSGWPQDKSSSRSQKSSRDSKSRSKHHSKSSRPSASAKKNNDSSWNNEESVEKKSSRRSDSTKKGNDSSSWGNDSSSESESNSSWKDDDKKRERRDKKKDDKKKDDDTESTASTVYQELYPDANFSMKDLTLVAKILKDDNKMLWLRIASRFRDKTGRILDPDVFEHKLTGKVASKGN